MNVVVIVLRRVLKAAWKHRWTFTVPVATLLLPATLYAVRLPEEYRATALVHLRSVRPEHIGRGLPEQHASLPEEMLATVRDRLTARIPVEAAAAVLVPDAAEDDPSRLGAVRAGFDYEQIGTSAFSVSVTGASGPRAADATNALVKAFLESERAERLRRAENNRSFHEGELVSAQKAYAKVVDRIDALRRDHATTLPDLRDTMREEMRQIANDVAAEAGFIDRARLRIQGLDDQLTTLETTMPRDLTSRAGAAEEALRLQLTEAQRALQAARKTLADLRSRYTEAHPDVVRGRSAVDVHQASVTQAVGALERVRKQARGDATRTAMELLASRRKGLNELRAVAQADITRAEERKKKLRTRQAELQTRLAGIPATEALLAPIERERDEAGAVLEARQSDAAASRAAAQFYRTADVSDVTGYRVDAWASAPSDPTGPRRWRYFLTALLLGLVVGYGIVLLRRRYETERVDAPEDVADLFPSAVVVGVPSLTPKPRGLGRLPVSDVFVGAYVVVCLGLSLVAVAAHRGWDGAPDWLTSLLLG